MDVIQLLPDSVANQIAAGEVIQRPASVVKELVENAIDAGATAVQIVIKDAGRTLIQVIDNGCGMSVTDARMAFERHATSKIRQATDLFTLVTMGFRGEALPSIAAVSEIEMRTMPRGEATGTRLLISASRVEGQQPDVCAPGTNIMVKRLFFNLPARRKFLKKDSIELGHIVKEFERLALVNASVEFTLTHNDVILHKLQPATLKQRITDLFGKNLDHQLIPVTTSTSLVDIDGFVSLPQCARRRGALQYFFVNGRNMRHAYFHKAVLSCYDSLIQADTQPSYFINFKVDPETIDVNIHPQKHEIKFENEQPVWQILQAAIKEALGRYNATSAIDFDPVDAPDLPTFMPNAATDAPTTDVEDGYNPFNTPSPSHPTGTYNKPYVPTDWDKLYASFQSSGTQTAARRPAAPPTSDPVDAIDATDDALAFAPPVVQLDQEHPTLIDSDTETPAMFQLKQRYIVCSSKSGLMIIDQHRAHTRILYDRYIANVQAGNIPSQRLIFPETITIDPSQRVIASSIQPTLADMGFDIAIDADGTCTISAIPSILNQAKPAEAFINILGAIAEADEDVQLSQWHRIALSMARSAAIRYGAQLSGAEMDTLVSDLLRLTSPNYTPDGRPTLHLIAIDDLTQRFK